MITKIFSDIGRAREYSDRWQFQSARGGGGGQRYQEGGGYFQTGGGIQGGEGSPYRRVGQGGGAEGGGGGGGRGGGAFPGYLPGSHAGAHWTLLGEQDWSTTTSIDIPTDKVDKITGRLFHVKMGRHF